MGEGAAIAPHGPGTFSFGAFVRDFLAEGEGLAMLVLESTDASADRDAFAAAGIGDFEPFFFERLAVLPDGASRRVAFSLAFARSPLVAEAGLLRLPAARAREFLEPCDSRCTPMARRAFPA